MTNLYLSKLELQVYTDFPNPDEMVFSQENALKLGTY